MANAGKTADEIERRAARSASQLAVLLPDLLCAQFVVKYGALTYCEAMQVRTLQPCEDMARDSCIRNFTACFAANLWTRASPRSRHVRPRTLPQAGTTAANAATTSRGQLPCFSQDSSGAGLTLINIVESRKACLPTLGRFKQDASSSGDDDITVAEHIAWNPKASKLPCIRQASTPTAQDSPWLSYTENFLVALWFSFAKAGLAHIIHYTRVGSRARPRPGK